MSKQVTPFYLDELDKWKYLPIQELKVKLWHNCIHSFDNLGSYKGHDFRVLHVYPMIRFIFSDEIEDMYTTREAFKWWGVDELVQSFIRKGITAPEDFEKEREKWKYKSNPVWGLRSSSYDNLDYEHTIAMFIWRSPKPIYSVKFIGAQTEEEANIPWNDVNYKPCLLVMCNTAYAEMNEWSNTSSYPYIYKNSSFPLWMDYVGGKATWKDTKELLQHHELGQKEHAEMMAQLGF